MTKHRLADLAVHLGAEVVGDTALTISRVRPLGDAGPEDLAFVHQARYLPAARESGAGVLLVPKKLREEAVAFGRPLLVVADSPLAVARLLNLLHPVPAKVPGIHPTAVIGEGCSIDASAHVGPFAVIGTGSRLEAGVVVEAHSVVGERCRLGEGARLHPHVVLYDDTELGARAEIHSGTVLGADGFGYASSGGVHHKIPQIGRTVIGADVEIGALTAIDRAALDATRVGDGTKIDNQVMVGHNVQIGKGCILCGQVGLAGSSKLGDYVVIAGGAGAADHLEIGDQVQVAASSVLMQDVAPGQVMAGVPAVPIRDWRRMTTAMARLPELLRRVRRLEGTRPGETDEPSE
jgi:UDP-3-O-[3-hydroxymyristoyl] glucosamine N-acyltransferase